MSLDIWGYSLFYRGLSNVYLCVLNVLSMTRAVNGLFGKLLNLASEEVILELVRTKCTPILLYALVRVFSVGKANLRSLDYTFIRLCLHQVV